MLPALSTPLTLSSQHRAHGHEHWQDHARNDTRLPVVRAERQPGQHLRASRHGRLQLEDLRLVQQQLELHRRERDEHEHGLGCERDKLG